MYVQELILCPTGQNVFQPFYKKSKCLSHDGKLERLTGSVLDEESSWINDRDGQQLFLEKFIIIMVTVNSSFRFNCSMV